MGFSRAGCFGSRGPQRERNRVKLMIPFEFGPHDVVEVCGYPADVLDSREPLDANAVSRDARDKACGFNQGAPYRLYRTNPLGAQAPD
jgi:hypothetical protein